MRALFFIVCLSLAGCGTTAGVVSGLEPPEPDLMIEPRDIKPLRKGGDSYRYAVIMKARNAQLVNRVKDLQKYIETTVGAPIIKQPTPKTS